MFLFLPQSLHHGPLSNQKQLRAKMRKIILLFFIKPNNIEGSYISVMSSQSCQHYCHEALVSSDFAATSQRDTSDIPIHFFQPKSLDFINFSRLSVESCLIKTTNSNNTALDTPVITLHPILLGFFFTSTHGVLPVTMSKRPSLTWANSAPSSGS